MYKVNSKTFSFLSVLLFSMLFSLAACADSPQSPVSKPSDGDNKGISLEEDSEDHSEDSFTALAVKYEGQDTQGRQCDFYVTISEEEEGHEGHEHEHESHILVKMDYETLDGHRPHDSEALFYLYDKKNGTYYDEDSNQANATLSLLSLSLKDPDVVPDVSKINEYIKDGELDQYIRVEFSQGVDSGTFKETLHELVEGKGSIDNKLGVLNRIQLISIGAAHGDHYHFPTCLGYQPVSLETVEFDLGGHDDDHDHGDHDDHDDGHDDHDHDQKDDQERP